ncbi:MAG TPA: DUF1552 domain-containing protein [Polyangiaceae bacterium]|nr:DUF1552 domain-containing protein [Polyangiaceae bacterium]
MIVSINRRFFLSGLGGVLVGLPLLEGLRPRNAEAAPPPDFRFAIFMRQANGVAQKQGTEVERFWPTNLGALTKASMAADVGRATSDLADYADKLLLVRGCKYNFSTSGCGHADGGLQCLTAAKPDGPNSNKALAMGESIDNRIVRALEPAGSEPLTLYAGPKSGYLDDILSYRGPKDRRTAEGNPANAYRRLFGVPDTNTDAATKLALQRKSVNDLVRGEMQTLMSKPQLSSSDRDRLNLHFQSIRDLEVTMQCQLPKMRYDEIVGVPANQVSSGANIEKIVAMQLDIIALAMNCGKSRCATLQIGNGNDQTQYVINGVTQERFHFISHRINSDGSSGDPIPNADMKHHEIDRKFAGFFKYLLDKLTMYTTPTGTVLDQGVAVWLNDLSSGPPHGSNNLPYVCAGSAGGFLKTGQYVEAAAVASNKYVTNNKFLSTIGAAVGVKNAAGAPLDDFGDPSLEKGLVPQMLA